jgi:hypothetical protein
MLAGDLQAQSQFAYGYAFRKTLLHDVFGPRDKFAPGSGSALAFLDISSSQRSSKTKAAPSPDKARKAAPPRRAFRPTSLL